MFLYRKGRGSFCWGLITGFTLLSFLVATVQPVLAQSYRGSDLITDLESREAAHISKNTSAQSQKDDVIYLKNGSVLRGVIFDLIPGRHIAIIKTDGSTSVIEISNVKRVSIKAISNDVVFLKNGSVVKGGIWDIVLGSHIAIILADGNRSVFSLSRIKKISKGTIGVEFDSAKLPQDKKGASDGMVEGEVFAEGIRTGGKVGLGLGIGVLTGLLGTGIGYFALGPDPMTPEALERYDSGNNDYKLGFKASWDKKTRSKKRGSFLVGGLIGSVIAGLLVAYAQSN